MSQQPGNAPENEVDAEAQQENVGRGNMAGSGEWPSPETPPTGPASGERGPTHGPEPREGVARLGDTDAGSPPQNFKDVLEADPVRGGSASVGDPDVDEPADPD